MYVYTNIDYRSLSQNYEILLGLVVRFIQYEVLVLLANIYIKSLLVLVVIKLPN